MTKNIARRRGAAAEPDGSVSAVGGVPIAKMSGSLLADILQRKLDESQSTATAVATQLQTLLAAQDQAFAVGRRNSANTQRDRAAKVRAFVEAENEKLLKNSHLLGDRAPFVLLKKVRAAYIQQRLIAEKLTQKNGKPHGIDTIGKWIRQPK